jgi:four helix bundle suffix protein
MRKEDSSVGSATGLPTRLSASAGTAALGQSGKAARAVHRLGAKENRSYMAYKPYIEERSPETVANLIICLIHQANYLLNQQIRRLEQDFLDLGGLRERMYNARLKTRRRKSEGW